MPLPEVKGLKAPAVMPVEARYGIIWGSDGRRALGVAAALDYATQRTQFDRPIAGFQLTQAKLVDMAVELHKGCCSHCSWDGSRTPLVYGRAGQLRQAQQHPRSHPDLPNRANHSGRQRDIAGVSGDPAHGQPGIGAHLRGHPGDAPLILGQASPAWTHSADGSIRMNARLEYTSEHHQFRELVHDFVQQTVIPAHEQWEKARLAGPLPVHRGGKAWSACFFSTRGVRRAGCRRLSLQRDRRRRTSAGRRRGRGCRLVAAERHRAALPHRPDHA